MKRLPLLIVTLTGLLALPIVSRAEDAKPGASAGQKPGGPGGGRMNPEERLKKMTETLGLSQEQQDKIKAIMEKNAPQMRELMSKGRENLTEEDKNKVRELMKGQMEEIGAVLTPEQKEKWKAEREAHGPGGKPGEKK